MPESCPTNAEQAANYIPFDTSKPGSVGVAQPGVEVKLGEDGEILIKGPNVFLGYWNNPEATAVAGAPRPRRMS